VTAGALGRRHFLALATGAAVTAAVPRRARATERPLRGGVLKQIGLEPLTFDVHATASCETQLVSSLVRRTLFKVAHGARYRPSDFTLAPDLALNALVSADGRTYTITLRPDVRWESRPPVNGRELVAADVKHSLERALRKSPYAPLLGPVERIDAPDRRTVRVHLADSFAPFVHSLAEPWSAIMPPEVEDRPGDLKATESLIGCGPFMLERYEPGVKAVFSRNPTYHARDLPYLDKVEWLFIKDRPMQLALFRAGQVDLPYHDARVPRSEVSALRRASPGFPVTSWDGLAVRSLAMRTDRPPFNDVRVRRALSLAVNRKTWVAEHLEGEGAEDHGPVPSAMRQWTLAARHLGEGARYLEHDPGLARKLLAAAGFSAGRSPPRGCGAADRQRGARAVHARVVSRPVRRDELGALVDLHGGGRVSLRRPPARPGRQSQPRGRRAARRDARGPAPDHLDAGAQADHRRDPASRRRPGLLRLHAVPPQRVVMGAARPELRAEELLRSRSPARGGLARPGLRPARPPFRG
jgi:ABC-type transport system substrate-binding protein